MALSRSGFRALALLLVALACAVYTPTPGHLRSPGRRLAAPIDAALRVPFGASLFGPTDSPLRAGDRVLGISLGEDERLHFPRDRTALARIVASAPTARSASLHVVRDGASLDVAAAVDEVTGWRRIVSSWACIVLGCALLLFGLTVACRSPHPVATPLFAVSWCAGAIALSHLDRTLPGDPGMLGTALRERLGLAAVLLMPAAVLHLAMRFPVVSPHFRRPTIAAVPYAFWFVPSAFAELHVRDAPFLGSLERIAVGASFAAAGVLVVASVTHLRAMTPIERARSLALLVGVGIGSALPFAHFVGAVEGPASPAAVVAGGLAFPLAVSWAIVRYGLLDPPERLRLGTSLGGRALEEAARVLSRARDPEAVLDAVRGLVAGHFGTSRVESVRPGAAPRDGLGRRGLELWRSAGAPRHRAVQSGARAEDPAPGLAEIALPMTSVTQPPALVVLGARHDGRPYTRAQVRVLESLAHVAATALDAAATARDLEMRVREKTTSLERAVADRQDVLHTAERIGRADDAAEIEAALEDFAKRRGARARWHTGATGAPQGRGRRLEASLGERALAVDGLPAPRLAEMAPQLDTLCAFAGIALGRLALLRELEIEVERQAGEIADITSRRLHAEFVRGVAHELRKPTEEVRRRVQALCEEGNPRRRRHELGRVRAATRELSRRLDLLLFHSGLRLDRRRVELVRIAREALEAARRACPDRDWAQEHLDPRIPLIGDPSRILSVAENLLDNATRATRPGQRIRVCTRIERPGLAHGVAVLEVEDAGVGIEAERLDDVFDPGVCFAPGGFGLGLAVCREIVAMHGGDIGVESRPGRTLFRVRWPQLPPADEGRA